MLIRGECDIVISQMSDVVPIFKDLLANEPDYERQKEHLWSVGLDSAGRILFIDLVALGGITQASVSIWSIVACALKRTNCTGIILVHNHDYGSKDPSQNDLDLSKKALELLNCALIELLDHIIIGAVGYLSLREAGLLQKSRERISLDEIGAVKEELKTVVDMAGALRLRVEHIEMRQKAEERDRRRDELTTGKGMTISPN